MENFYTAYSKVVQDTTYYFVKKYVTFPEYKDVPGVLESYGMHTDFKRACEIALINDQEIRKHLLADLQNNQGSAKVIHMSMTKGIIAVQ
jgi:alpha-D-ribose 1-methylphosphonate 5-triphosphate synthase subunit PhnI